jgi:F-type H+-transporting ATPase subunit epsilon
MSTYALQIVTPEGLRLDTQVEALHLRTSDGYVSIRAGHADYIATLDIGIVTVTVEGKERKAACGGGFLTVSRGEARLLATSFEYAEDIDVARAQAAQRRAEAQIAASKEAADIDLAKVKLARALNRLKVAE